MNMSFQMLSVSLLSSSTFLIICIQKQSPVQENDKPQIFLPSSQHSHNPFDQDSNVVHVNQSRHGSKLVDLMKSGTELR